MGFNQWLGLRPSVPQSGRALRGRPLRGRRPEGPPDCGTEGDAVLLDTAPEHEVVPGVVHFAVLATLAEVSAARAAGASVVPATVALSLLAPAKPGRLVGRGRLLRLGKRLATAEGEVLQDGKLVAKAVVTFAVMS